MSDGPSDLQISPYAGHDDWVRAASLIAEAIPNAIISKLGPHFGSLYYKRLSIAPASCSYLCFDSQHILQGIIIGTLDHPRAASYAMKGNAVSLALAANLRLLRPAVLTWIFRAILGKFRERSAINAQSPAAELVVIAVSPDAKGKGVSQSLIARMESFMQSNGLSGPYTILTEASNARANGFYRKIGAAHIRTVFNRGREINEWHKFPGVRSDACGQA